MVEEYAVMSEDIEKQQGIIKMIEILRSHDIVMTVRGCGCCGSPGVEFHYKGEKIVDADCCNFTSRTESSP